MLHDGASLHILESLREVAKKDMPNTITFIPHRMKKRFVRVYSSKVNELVSHMQRGEDTLKRELLNLLVWAMPALILSEDEASTELHKEHHSRSAGLNQRLAEAERDEWGFLIQRALMNQQDEEERKNANSNQLEDKEQAYLKKVNRAIFKANNGCLRAAKQIMMGSTQATQGEETTKMIQAKLPRDDLPEEEWKKMNEEIEECKRLAWKIKPLSRRRVLARLEMTKNGAGPGMSRRRNAHLKALQYVPDGLSSIRELGPDVDDGPGKQRRNTTVVTCQHCSADKRGGQPGRIKENKITTDCTPGNTPETDRICRC